MMFFGLKTYIDRVVNVKFDALQMLLMFRVYIMCAIGSLVYTLHDFMMGVALQNVLLAVMITVYYAMAAFCMAKFSSSHRLLVFSAIVHMVVIFMSMLTVGEIDYVNGSSVIDFAFSLLVTIIVFKGNVRIGILVAQFVGFIAILWLSTYESHILHPHIVVRSHDSFWFDLWELLIRLVFTVSISATFIKIMNEQFHTIKEQNILLADQHLEIKRKNDQLLAFNKGLEVLVDQNSAKIDELNGKLKEFTFVNTHKIKNPLSTIVGIVNQMQTQEYQLHDEEFDKQLGMLKNEAENLDKMVNELNATLKN
jgi:signal transduction histidine kinase